MAKRKKGATARKAKSKKVKATKKSVKRAAGRKPRQTSKKIAAKSRKRPSTRKPHQPKEMIPLVEGEVIDVVDEPMPGVIRVTEIEASRVTVPDSDDGEG